MQGDPRICREIHGDAGRSTEIQVRELDNAVGHTTRTLLRLGLSNRTLILFTGDTGRCVEMYGEM